ncbi:MAG: hypothetical protein JWM65_2006 [Sphingomonas bacterium]|jgi:hypothetical protein|nr:hypothetical protein [Sphingomonas bacterium]
MRALAAMVGMAMLTGCATLAPIDKSLPIGRPSKFNSDPARYDHKAVYIRAYLATSPHWWQFFFYERPGQDYDLGCLSFWRNDWLMNNRYQVNGEYLLVKGTFLKDATRESVIGNCANGNGFIMDEDFMKKRYGDHYRKQD